MGSATNWFATGGQAYAQFRPRYPDHLARTLAPLPATRGLALDVGCGSGQFAVRLGPWFDATLGVDPSAGQLAHALPGERVRYTCGAAEALPVADHRVDLIAVAQAVHWFDLPAFYGECRRVAAPGAVIALIAYGVQHLDGDVGERFRQFYAEDLGGFWPPERRLVEDGYRTLPFPFDELPLAPMAITQETTLAGLLGYVSTWSAIRAATGAGRSDLLERFAADLAQLWGDPDDARTTTWPVHTRVGSLGV